MALLEIGANVETNGYPSRFYSTRNFIFGTEANTWTFSNDNGELINNCHRRRYSLSLPSPAQILGSDKELVKQTILKHEAMVKDQIQELHRLYQKQRELMDELRRTESYKHNNISIEISWSHAPKLALVHDPNPGISLVEGLLKDSKPSNYNYKKVGNKILDLELPADEYIDCEEGDSVEDERIFRVAEVESYTSNGTQGPIGDGLFLGPSSAQLVSEGEEDPKNTNLSVTPAICSETLAFQSIWVNDKENEFEDKILMFHVNRKSHTPFGLHSSHTSPSDICQIQSDNQKIDETGNDCVIGVQSSCNLPDLGDKKNENEKKHNCLTRNIDLNSCLNEDVDLPVDVHFPALPESPQQNSECSPARGDSDEKQLETPYRLAGQEDEVRIGAEALVSISAFVVPNNNNNNNNSQMTDFPSAESLMDSPLHWFAKIVSSIKENEFQESADIDYFEAMTLNLTERENLHWCCKNKITDQNGKQGGSSLVPLRSACKGWKKSSRVGLASKVAEPLLKNNQTDDTDLRIIKKRGLLVSWEKTSKKRREPGQRYPTSSQSVYI